MIRAVLFDFVGTLAHAREPVGHTYARVARDFSVDASPDALQKAFEVTLAGMPPMAFPDRTREIPELERGWWHDLVERTFHAGAPGVHFDSFEAFFDRLFRFFATDAAWQKVPDAEDVLWALRSGGLRTGILSNFDRRLLTLLEALGLGRLLDVVVLPSDAGAAKPAGRIFAAAADRLGLTAGQILYVGDDEELDLAAAEAAGMSARRATPLVSLLDLVGAR